MLRIGRQIAEGLAAAHAKDLIHRDIKPGNILLETGIRDRVKITDFGLARAADDASLTQSGMIAGTPMYMAPEQALGHKLDQRADLFSLGSVLYQMVSGRPPFRASTTRGRPEASGRRHAPPDPRDHSRNAAVAVRHHHETARQEPGRALPIGPRSRRSAGRLRSEPQGARGVTRPPPRLGPRPAVRAGRNQWMAAALLLVPVIILVLTETFGISHLLRDHRTPPAPRTAGIDAASVARGRRHRSSRSLPLMPPRPKDTRKHGLPIWRCQSNGQTVWA